MKTKFVFSCALLLLSGCIFSPDKKANVYGEVSMNSFFTIKYGGKVVMEYNGRTQSSTLTNRHVEDIYNIYDCKFENIEIADGKKATFIVKLMNGFGSETTLNSTTLSLNEGDNKFRIYVNPL